MVRSKQSFNSLKINLFKNCGKHGKNKKKKRLEINNKIKAIGGKIPGIRRYYIEKIVDVRCRVRKGQVFPEMQIKWKGFSSKHNSWHLVEKYDFYNLAFREYFTEKFEQYEAQIYIYMANIKQRVKKKIRHDLREYPKCYNMPDVFDAFVFKALQTFPFIMKSVPKQFIKLLQKLTIKSYFFQLDVAQRMHIAKQAAVMARLEDVKVLIMNDIDYEQAPLFNYITKNYIADKLKQSFFDNPVDVDQPKGCQCDERSCNLSSGCCPKMANEPFAYRNVNGLSIIRLGQQEAIIECSDKCSCSLECVNRATQHKRDLTFCLYKTTNRGWGLRNGSNKPIKHGSFIIEYTGELLNNEEAEERKITSYLFDINMERLDYGFYTVDAFKYGNLARFINHSCEPNASIWVVNNCMKDKKTQRLCIFAERDIQPFEEITIEYHPKTEVSMCDDLNCTQSSQVSMKCHCGSTECRGTIY